MAASAADIRSALSLPERGASAGPSQPRKTYQPAARKPEGISRELYSLIGPSAPSLAAQLTKPKLKKKPNFGVGGVKTKWELRKFKNSARGDGLELEHWVKVIENPNTEYSFAKYNIQPNGYTYTQDEYAKFLDDKEWTKEETDYLFSFAKDYDTRWYIIHDRYNFPNGPQRTLEDLKDRYYSVCRKLIRNRPWAGDETSKTLLIANFQFDKEREMTRKRYIESLEQRTPEQIAEEEALYIEVRRLEQNERKFKRDRENLLRTLAGMDSGLPDIVEDDPVASGVMTTGDGGFKAAKRKKGGLEDSPATPSTTSLPAIKRPNTTKSIIHDTQHCIIRTDIPPSAIATKAAHTPAYARSWKMPAPKATVAAKINQALAELGISASRLVMPTRDNMAQLEALIDLTAQLLETKRLVEKVEHDVAVLRNRVELRDEEDTLEAKMEGVDTMDVDSQTGADAEGETEDDTGRAESVISARSGRGVHRKQARRSQSMSSVDTTSTRAVNKRQKRSCIA